MSNIFEEIANEIESTSIIENDKIHLTDPNYKALELKDSNFHHVRKFSSGKKIAFIDGGNSETIGSNNLSIALIKSNYTIFTNHIKIKSKNNEIITITKLNNNDSQENSNNMDEYLKFITKIKQIHENEFDIDENILKFKTDDETLKEGLFNIKISKINDVIRRFYEIQTAIHIAGNDLDTGDIIVFDGSLRQCYTNEKKLFDKLVQLCNQKGILITALAKSSSLYTSTGNSIQSYFDYLSSNREDIWYYDNVLINNNPEHPSEILFVKLHAKSKNIFQFEILNSQYKMVDLDKVIGYISVNSQDPVFLGYPYGLVLADQMARASNEEITFLKTRLIMLSKKINKIDLENSSHDILDNLKF